MVKSVLVSIQFLGVLLLSTYNPKDVKVHHTAPLFAMLDEEVEVTVYFEKGKVDGFAKYQINVPDGMTVTPGEIQGASFTFKEGEAKFIWMALPEESDFEITYTLKIENQCKVGNNDIEQWFSYLEKNERKTTVLPLHVMEVAGEDVSNSEVSDGLANGKRTVTQLAEDHYKVEIALYKDGIKGFAKLQETLPAGMRAEALNKANGVFTQLENKVKIVWFSIPEEENLSIVYELFADAPMAEQLDIMGEFTFLKENETKTVTLEQVSFKGLDLAENSTEDSTEVVDNTIDNITDEVENAVDDSTDTVTDPIDETVNNTIDTGAEEVDNVDETISDTTDNQVDETIDNTIDQTQETVDNTTDEVVDNSSDETQETIDNTESTTDETTDNSSANNQTDEVVIDNLGDLTDVPNPDNGVSYRVQIVAGKNVVDEVYFKKRHKFVQPFDIENHMGWIKYTTGTYDAYKEARDSRVYINNNYNFDGPFVTAYNDGVRITVQEALMITRQQWYQ